MEVVGSNEGEFMEEFWVKTNPPQRVVVSGIFICPKLLVRKFINSLDFTLVDFTPTYYGASSTKPILIKNFSSSSSMFCVMAEIKGKTMVSLEGRYLPCLNSNQSKVSNYSRIRITCTTLHLVNINKL